MRQTEIVKLKEKLKGKPCSRCEGSGLMRADPRGESSYPRCTECGGSGRLQAFTQADFAHLLATVDQQRHGIRKAIVWMQSTGLPNLAEELETLVVE